MGVPDAFYKVILAYNHNKPQAIGFVMKNEELSGKISKYAVSVDKVENITGLDFYTELPDTIQKEVESNYNLKKWLWDSENIDLSKMAKIN